MEFIYPEKQFIKVDRFSWSQCVDALPKIACWLIYLAFEDNLRNTYYVWLFFLMGKWVLAVLFGAYPIWKLETACNLSR